MSVAVSYDQLSFQLRQDFIRLNDRQMLIPITLEIENKQLTFKEENGAKNGRLAIYGIIKNLSNRFVLEFDDDLLTTAPPDPITVSLERRSIYQKVVALDQGTRYRLDLVVKDLNSFTMQPSTRVPSLRPCPLSTGSAGKEKQFSNGARKAESRLSSSGPEESCS